MLPCISAFSIIMTVQVGATAAAIAAWGWPTWSGQLTSHVHHTLTSYSALASGGMGHFTAAYEAPPGTGAIIHDLTHNLTTGAVLFESPDGITDDHRRVFQQRKRGDICNQSTLRLNSAHTGTHLDAPSHFCDDAFEDGRGVESLSLHTLNGPAVLVDMPPHLNITDAALQSVSIPLGATRMLFRTRNTVRDLMRRGAFDSSYTAFTTDGAEWLTKHRPTVRLVGVDYLSIAIFADLRGAHEEMLSKGIIAVEGLNLEALTAGVHQLHCLPIKLNGSDGAPVRCITIA